MSIAIEVFLQAGFPTEFLILLVCVTVAATLMLLGILVGAEQERRVAARKSRTQGQF